jgi:uncharacterized protein (TIGR02271 family)
MRNTTDLTSIQNDWDVYGNDGAKIGSIAEVGDNYVLVQKGLLFVHDIYIPTSSIERVENDSVWLNVSKDEVESMGWDEPPTGASGGTFSGEQAAQGSYATEESFGGKAYSGSARNTDDETTARSAGTAYDTDTAYDTGTGRRTGNETQRIREHEEELGAQKTARQAGEVQVSKDVIEEHQTLDVPVTREEVRVRRVPASGDASADDATFNEGETVRIPVMKEDVEVTKRPRVTGEVEIDKVARQDTEQVGDTVRKERVNVQSQGDTNLGDDSGRQSTLSDQDAEFKVR